jgi:hypothetical protein
MKYIKKFNDDDDLPTRGGLSGDWIRGRWYEKQI